MNRSFILLQGVKASDIKIKEDILGESKDFRDFELKLNGEYKVGKNVVYFTSRKMTNQR